MGEKELLQERAKIAEEIITRAWSDASFKTQLLEDPAKAVESAYGLKLPSSIKVTVIEETEDMRYLVIPFRGQVGGELSNEQLEAVAGGLSSGGVTGSRYLSYSAFTNPISSPSLEPSLVQSLDTASISTLC